MILNALKKRPDPVDRARTDDDLAVYAVGDIHGSAGALDRLHALIAADAENRSARRRVVVHLGDYVDRGPSTREVLDRLAGGGPSAFEVVNLKGNHDAWFLRFLDDPDAGPDWLANGGQATLLSYGVRPRPDLPAAQRMEAIRTELTRRLPRAHRRVLEEARLHHVEGDYLFVHAGVRPRIRLAAQSADDLLWIRDAFLESSEDHGHVVVHGHTVVDRPQIHGNRIAVDTGAYATGRLSAVVLHGSEKRFLTT
jgi:serine/threonine protein phosphatase 1